MEWGDSTQRRGNVAKRALLIHYTSPFFLRNKTLLLFRVATDPTKTAFPACPSARDRCVLVNGGQSALSYTHFSSVNCPSMANFKLPSQGQLGDQKNPWECNNSHNQGWASSSTWLVGVGNNTSTSLSSLKSRTDSKHVLFLFLFPSFSFLLGSRIWLMLQQLLWAMKQFRKWWWCRKKVRKQRRSLALLTSQN